VAHKKKIIKCFVCSTEWTASDDEAHASTLKCPHCGMNDFSGNFIIKTKEDDADSKYKPHWGPPAGEKSEGEVKTESAAAGKMMGRESEHSGSARSARTTYLGSGGSNAAESSGSGGEQVHSYAGGHERKSAVSKTTGKKGEPKSLSEELTSGCFIVTATYGTESYDQIKIFYRFRDEFLLRRTAGKAFTQIYYAISPYPAAVIRRSKTLKAASRSVLDGLASVIRRLL
jgi:hypothetical protein